MTTPKHIKSVLEKLKKSENELGEFCIEKAADALEQNGYQDSRLWARNLLSAMLGDLASVEDPIQLEEMVLGTEGMERDVLEAFYDTFAYLEEELRDTDPMSIRDTIIHTVSKTIDIKEKNNYRKLYG